LLIVTGVGVAVAMVTVADRARESADRHRRAQVLVERVRASGQELSAISAQALADTWASGSLHPHLDQAVVTRGYVAYGELASALQALRSLGHDRYTAKLEPDAGALYLSGLQTLAVARAGRLRTAMRDEQLRFRPVVERLNSDATNASRYQQTIAERASSNARTAFFGSLVVGLIALVLLGWRLQRLRRESVLAAARRAIEIRSEQRLRALVEHSTDVVTVIGPDLRVQWQAASIERMLGHEPASLIGRSLMAIVHPDDARVLERFLTASLKRPGSHTISARFRDADGGWRHVETIAENRLSDPAVAGVVLSMRDATERKTLEDQLRFQAFHDPLTGLANRSLFEDRLTQAVAGARRNHRSFAVLYLDLDDFKTINDSLGHARGDDVMRDVAARIERIVRPTDTAARLGGDEFAVLMEVLEDEDEAQLVARRILDVLALPFLIEGRELRITASIGVTTCSSSADIGDLVRNADIAMYAAKQQGKASIRTFQPGMRSRAMERLQLIAELREAVGSQQFELEYQPIVELRSGAIIGTEALVRWQHPERQRLTPEHFIALAEETGVIVPLGLWILKTACAQARDWQRAFPAMPPLGLSVNVSTRQLQEPDFAAAVADVIRTTGLRPETLVLEITETVLFDDQDTIVEQLRALKALGLRIAVDDFGTGYAALSHLQHYPIDILKIDRSFVDGIDRDPGNANLVRGIVNLGASMLLDVIVEGIEEPGQANQFREMHLTLGQGFLFSPPVASDDLYALLTAGTASVTRQG
jgi:diguanylate cyclase (GGDEF)-like protein/PAS domain S-box-containing protein